MYIIFSIFAHCAVPELLTRLVAFWPSVELKQTVVVVSFRQIYLYTYIKLNDIHGVSEISFKV